MWFTDSYASDGGGPELGVAVAGILWLAFLIACAAAALYVGGGIALLIGQPQWCVVIATAIIMGVLWWNGPMADRASSGKDN